MNRKVAVSVVCYNAAVSLNRLLTALSYQTRKVDAVLIVDNSEIATQLNAVENLTVINFPENRGVSEALSKSFIWAKENSIDDLWLFDQDSIPHPQALSILLDARSKLDPTNSKVAVIGTEIIDKGVNKKLNGFRWNGTNFEQIPENLNSIPYQCDALLHSGSLVMVNLIRQSDLPNSKMFIDAVDFEFCYNLRSRGLQIYLLPQVLIEHNLGRKTEVHLPWRTAPMFYFHLSPLRIYCICRNFSWIEFKNSKGKFWPRILFARLKHCVYFSIGSLFGSDTPIRGILAAFIGTSLGILGPSFWPDEPHFKKK